MSSATYAALCAGIGAGSLSAGLLRSGLELGSVYRLAAVPAAAAFAPALLAVRQGVEGVRS